MPLQDRKTLKGFFTAGSRPSEANFQDLIDSMYNKLDDHLNNGDSAGNTSPGLDTSKLSSLFDKTAAAKAANPNLFVKLYNDADKGLGFTDAKSGDTIMHLDTNGNVGIGTSSPDHKLQVDGTVAAAGRIGTYSDSKVSPQTVMANGQWQKIITNLDGLNAFEVVASASGGKGSGNYALLHAVALSAYGDSKSCITQSAARYKGLFQILELRWTGTTHSYNLEIRTRFNFGNGIPIKYSITQLISE